MTVTVPVASPCRVEVELWRGKYDGMNTFEIGKANEDVVAQAVGAVSDPAASVGRNPRHSEYEARHEAWFSDLFRVPILQVL